MTDFKDFMSNDEIAWCPGCGDFGILSALKKAFITLGKQPNEILLVSGIGQAAKLPHYIKTNVFNGLHGRALPVAAAAKIANRNLTVVVTTGDGDCYGEGGNHLIHNIRRNIDITVIVCDNQIYGLTKGQASPTTDQGIKNKIQTNGVILQALAPLEMAIALGCGFVARGYSANGEHLAWLISEGIKYKGLSLIDVLQPCVTFNKTNTYEWFAKRVYKINDDSSYDVTNKFSAYQKAAEWNDKIPLGIIYKTEKESYGDKSGLNLRSPLNEEESEKIDISGLLKKYK